MREPASSQHLADAGPPWSTSARPRLVARARAGEGRAEDAELAGGLASLRGAGRVRTASGEGAAPGIPRFPVSFGFLSLPPRPGPGGCCTLTSGRGGCSVDLGVGGREPQLSVEQGGC